MPVSLEIVCGLALLAMLLHYYMTCTYDFWRKRRVPGPKPELFFGTGKDLMLAKTTPGHYTEQIYEEFNHAPMIEFFLGRQPVLLLNDLDLIKDVLIKDFNKFMDRGFKCQLRVEPLSQHLFNLEPAEWRPLRAKLSTVFSSGKIKDMYPFILDSATSLIKHLDKELENGEIVKIRTTVQKYILNVIGTCGFGINVKILEQENSEFHKMAMKIFSTNLENVLRVKSKIFFPEFYNFLGHIIPKKEVTI